MENTGRLHASDDVHVRKGTPYPLVRKMGEPQGRFGSSGEISCSGRKFLAHAVLGLVTRPTELSRLQIHTGDLMLLVGVTNKTGFWIG
jgi:hypothetical protein